MKKEGDIVVEIDQTLKKLGNGKIVNISPGNAIFQLDSYNKNPVIKPQDLGLTWIENNKLQIGAVFNGGAEIYRDKVILMPRCHKNYKKRKFFDEKLGIERYYMEDYVSEVWALQSENGIHFEKLNDIVIKGDGSEHKDFTYGIEDIRIVKSYVDEFILVGCGKIKLPFKGTDADRIAVYVTKNFQTISYCGIVKIFDSRNAVPFPEPIDGKLFMLFRFHPNIHIDHLKAGIDQLLNPGKYDRYWKEIYERRKRNLLISAGTFKHEKEKIGPGPQLIKTKEGWLMIYHAVGEISEELCKAYGLKGRITRSYSICAALLDLNEPNRILARTRFPIYIPSHPWELEGNEQYPVDVPNVVFPVGAIVRGDKLLLYCGAGDKYEVLLSCRLSYLINYLFQYCNQ